MPEPPDIKPTFSGPLVIISERDFPLNIRSERLYCGLIPSITSMLARPKSASNTTTFLPSLLSEIARLIARFDLPTPPLPLVMVITLDSTGTAFSALIIFLRFCA